MRVALVRFVLVCCGLGLASGSALARGPGGKAFPPGKAKAVDAAVKEEMNKQQVVGVAIGIIEDGRVVYLNGYGLADREKNKPVTADTVFNWASNCKPLAAVAAMQLVDRKMLDLDADVREYVPEFPAPANGDVITTRHLLCHQSGIPHYSNGEVVSTKRKHDVADPYMDPVLALDKFSRSPLMFSPGDRTSYSSYAYILLSAVVQRAGKAPFVDQVKERIAKPLGMKSLQLDVASKDQKNWAAGYTEDDKGRTILAEEEAHYWKHGAGGFKSTIGDFALWAEALINHKLVSGLAERQMWTVQKTANGKATEYGLGFHVDDQSSLRVSHSGEQDEVRTRLVIYPKTKRGVVVMINCEFADTGDFTTAILRAMK
jgi:serine beta-lactamase-like protein LACTB